MSDSAPPQGGPRREAETSRDHQHASMIEGLAFSGTPRVRMNWGSTPRTSTREAGSTPGTGRMIRWENPLRSVVRRGGEGQSPAPLLRMHDNLSTSFAKRTGQRSAIRRVEGQPAALKEAEWNAVERGLRRERRAGAPRMYRADKVREEPGRGQGAAQEHWAAYRTKTEKGPDAGRDQQRIALAPTALYSNSYFKFVYERAWAHGARSGRGNASRQAQTTVQRWPRNAAGAAGVSAAALGRNG